MPFFSLGTFLCLFHFIQVTISCIINLHLSFGHDNIRALQNDRMCVSHKNIVYDLADHESSIAQ